jgi:hypothetical protein
MARRTRPNCHTGQRNPRCHRNMPRRRSPEAVAHSTGRCVDSAQNAHSTSSWESRRGATTAAMMGMARPDARPEQLLSPSPPYKTCLAIPTFPSVVPNTTLHSLAVFLSLSLSLSLSLCVSAFSSDQVVASLSWFARELSGDS